MQNGSLYSLEHVLFIEENLMDLVVDEFHLVFVLYLEEVSRAIALWVEVPVVDAEIAEDFVLTRADAHFCVAEDEIVWVIDHSSHDSGVSGISVGVVVRVVEFVDLPAVQGNDKSLLVHHCCCLCLQLAGVIAGE